MIIKLYKNKYNKHIYIHTIYNQKNYNKVKFFLTYSSHLNYLNLISAIKNYHVYYIIVRKIYPRLKFQYLIALEYNKIIYQTYLHKLYNK